MQMTSETLTAVPKMTPRAPGAVDRFGGTTSTGLKWMAPPLTTMTNPDP